MISLCRDATKRVIVLMYCLWNIEISCCTCLSNITAYQPEQLRQQSYEHDASA